MAQDYKAVTGLISVELAEIDSSERLTTAVDKVVELVKRMFGLNQRNDINVADGSMHLLSTTDEKAMNPSLTVTVRFYSTVKLITISIDGCGPLNTIDLSGVNEQAKEKLTTVDKVTNSKVYHYLNNNVMEAVRLQLVQMANCKKVIKIPLLKRGMNIDNYFSTSDERVVEYDFNKTLFDGNSKYQNVRIYQSPTFGNALFLDDLQNLADSDLPYTHGLMNFGKNCYKDKEILILGGGDGGLLHELLKEKPKFVTMVDIDQMVIDSCRVHLRKSCGNVLDNLEGDNYHVIVDDCLIYLDRYIREGKKFDFIFNDLTDIPLSGEETEIGANLWAFVKNLLNLSLNCLHDHGKYMNHVRILI